MVSGYNNGDISSCVFINTKSLGEGSRLKALKVHQILQFQVTGSCLALTELLDEPLKAISDSLARHKMVILNVSTHILGQKRFVAVGKQKGSLLWLKKKQNVDS